MLKILRKNGGFALILTILMISLMVTLTLQFSGTMRTDLYAAANLKDGIRLLYIAKSGFNFACAVLLEDASETDFDSLNEPWADSGNLSSRSKALFDEGRFEVKVRDHSGRICINRLVDESGNWDPVQKEILGRFLGLEEFGLDPEEAENLMEAIKDYMDADDEPTGFGGAESADYQAMGSPSPCKNGPLEFLEELLRVKGMTRELYDGTGEKPGISKYLTVYGDGKININTADPLVLRALSSNMDRKMAEDMKKYREDEEHDLSNTGWYKNVSGMEAINLPGVITVSSAYFEIESEGVLDMPENVGEGLGALDKVKKRAMRKGAIGMVERKKGEPLKILSWRVM
jgi:general secretion pathway protein K